ncbi:MAG: C4-dicarboxylate TRAP transporter substrate-binding protein, partial [Planctomycetota bacterium]|nr:C4-dicarboxylate TRAP transporter substrate-binding protein [Planctomycetota bacterium]
PTEPYHLAWEGWAKKVAERTNGEVKIEIYHSAQLGVEEDIIEQMRMGAPVGQSSDPARMGNYVKEFAMMNLPYFVDTLAEVEKLATSPTVNKWRRDLEEQYGIHILSLYYCQGFRQVYTNNVAVHKPGDLKGLRIRAAPAQAWQELVRALGGTPVAIPYVEIYSAIQTRAVDGSENGYVPGYHASMYEVCKFIGETNHLLQMNCPVTSAEWFRGLPAEWRRIVDEECEAAGKAVSYEIVNKLSAEYKQRFKDKGVTIVDGDQIDLDAFRANSVSAYRALGLLDARNAVYRELGKN